MFITLTLLITLAQQPAQQPTLPPDHEVVLMFSNRNFKRMRLDEAERLWTLLSKAKNLDESNQRLFAALTIALGTLPEFERLTAPGLPGSRERLDWEVRRGVRGATQRQAQR